VTLRRPARRGLSLLEIMLALAILLLSMVAIGKLVDIGADRGMDARMNTRAARLAQAKLAEVEAGLIPLDGTATGQFDDEPGWTWTVEPVSQGTPNLYTVTVRVTRDYQGRTFETALTQLLYDPAKVGSAAQAQTTSSSSGSSTSGTTTGTTTGGTSP
jgi:general secretion pathway protein I